MWNRNESWRTSVNQSIDLNRNTNTTTPSPWDQPVTQQLVNNVAALLTAPTVFHSTSAPFDNYNNQQIWAQPPAQQHMLSPYAAGTSQPSYGSNMLASANRLGPMIEETWRTGGYSMQTQHAPLAYGFAGNSSTVNNNESPLSYGRRSMRRDMPSYGERTQPSAAYGSRGRQRSFSPDKRRTQYGSNSRRTRSPSPKHRRTTTTSDEKRRPVLTKLPTINNESADSPKKAAALPLVMKPVETNKIADKEDDGGIPIPGLQILEQMCFQSCPAGLTGDRGDEDKHAMTIDTMAAKENTTNKLEACGNESVSHDASLMPDTGTFTVEKPSRTSQFTNVVFRGYVDLNKPSRSSKLDACMFRSRQLRPIVYRTHLDDDLEMYGNTSEYRRILLNQPRVLVSRLPASVIDRVLLDSYVDRALMPSTSNMNNSKLSSSKKKSTIIDDDSSNDEGDDRNDKSNQQESKNVTKSSATSRRRLLDSDDDDYNDDDTAASVNDDDICRVEPTTSRPTVSPPKVPAKYQSLRRECHQAPVELDFLPKANLTNTRIPKKTNNPSKPNFDVDSVLNDLELPKKSTDKTKHKSEDEKTKPTEKSKNNALNYVSPLERSRKGVSYGDVDQNGGYGKPIMLRRDKKEAPKTDPVVVKKLLQRVEHLEKELSQQKLKENESSSNAGGVRNNSTGGEASTSVTGVDDSFDFAADFLNAPHIGDSDDDTSQAAARELLKSRHTSGGSDHSTTPRTPQDASATPDPYNDTPRSAQQPTMSARGQRRPNPMMQQQPVYTPRQMAPRTQFADDGWGPGFAGTGQRQPAVVNQQMSLGRAPRTLIEDYRPMRAQHTSASQQKAHMSTSPPLTSKRSLISSPPPPPPQAVNIVDSSTSMVCGVDLERLMVDSRHLLVELERHGGRSPSGARASTVDSLNITNDAQIACLQAFVAQQVARYPHSLTDEHVLALLLKQDQLQSRDMPTADVFNALATLLCKALGAPAYVPSVRPPPHQSEPKSYSQQPGLSRMFDTSTPTSFGSTQRTSLTDTPSSRFAVDAGGDNGHQQQSLLGSFNSPAGQLRAALNMMRSPLVGSQNNVQQQHSMRGTTDMDFGICVCALLHISKRYAGASTSKIPSQTPVDALSNATAELCAEMSGSRLQRHAEQQAQPQHYSLECVRLLRRVLDVLLTDATSVLQIDTVRRRKAQDILPVIDQLMVYAQISPSSLTSDMLWPITDFALTAARDSGVRVVGQ